MSKGRLLVFQRWFRCKKQQNKIIEKPHTRRQPDNGRTDKQGMNKRVEGVTGNSLAISKQPIQSLWRIDRQFELKSLRLLGLKISSLEAFLVTFSNNSSTKLCIALKQF